MSGSNDVLVSTLTTLETIKKPPLLPAHVLLSTLAREQGQHRSTAYHRYRYCSEGGLLNASSSNATASSDIPDANKYSDRKLRAELMMSAETAAMSF